MQTVILAAGRGTRMRPLTEDIPKPLLPVGDCPLVEHVANAAVTAGASELVFVVGYRGELVEDHFGSTHRDVPVRYVHQAQQQGTADALRVAREALSEDWCVVLNGDMLVEEDALNALYRERAAVGAVTVEDPTSYGVLELDEDERVEDLIEKPADPPSNLANAGAYTFPPGALEELDAIEESARGEYELTDLLVRVTREHPVDAVHLDRWLDVGRPWELLEANEWVLESLAPATAGTVSDDATLDGAVAIEEGARIREGVTIEGPVLVRSGADVGPNAYVRGPTVIGPEARVGHAVEIKRSVLFSGATVGHLSYVGDSLLGPDVNFGAGTTVANLRHDDAPVRTTVKGEQVSTGRRKFGIVAGPGAKTGINTSLNAGLVLPAEGRTLPGAVLLKQEDV